MKAVINRNNLHTVAHGNNFAHGNHLHPAIVNKHILTPTPTAANIHTVTRFDLAFL